MNILISEGLDTALTVLLYVVAGGLVLYALFVIVWVGIFRRFVKKTMKTGDPFDSDFFKGFK